MLFLVCLALSFAKGVIAFGLGAALAGALYLIGKIVHCNLPAAFRWGVAAALVVIYTVHALSSGPAAGSGEPGTGYEDMQFWCDVIFFGLAALILLLLGTAISIIKEIFALCRAGLARRKT